MENLEQKSAVAEVEGEKEKRGKLILRYIEKQVIGANESAGQEEEKELEEYYEKMYQREKADVLYEKLMAYTADRQAEAARRSEAEEQEPMDPYLISEIKVLFKDEDVKKLFSERYAEARIDAKKFRLSELGNLWNEINKDIHQKEEEYQRLEQDIHLNKISGKGKVSSTKSRMARFAEKITFLEKRKKDLEKLKGFPETSENTDSVAHFQYERLKEYKRQLDEGFVWLPSRRKIHQETVSAILNHRWPVLIGEAGSGKSDQADAAAIELTGYPPTTVACSSKTGEKDLIKDLAIDPETGGSFEVYGPLMRAMTGYEDSRQKEPSFKTGRIVRFDEAYRIPHDSPGYSIIKEARQLKPGDLFYGKPVLPGAAAIWTTNPPGVRYRNRYSPDAALRRELAENMVDYPEMSNENPELYEFAIASLFDENNHIAAAKEELAPQYEKKEIPEDKRVILEDGSIVVAMDEIIENMTDMRHGALWRFCGAIKSLQESFVYGNAETEKYPDTLLRVREDADGNIETTTDNSGKPLTLSTSTVTLGEMASWMKGFNERKQKQDESFRVDTLTEWLNFKINTYLKQADKADREKLRALFRHFGFLDKSVIPDLVDAKPLINKEIGYLSPRTPRPVHLEKPIAPPEDGADKPELPPKEIKEYETVQVMLESGGRILMKNKEFELSNGKHDLALESLVPLQVEIGRKIRVEGENFIYAGIVEDAKSKDNGKPVTRLENEKDLYRVMSAEELDFGIMEEFHQLVGETGIDDMKEDLLDYWEMEGCKEEQGEFIF